MADFESGFSCVAAPAKALNIVQIVRQFRVRSDRQDMIAFQPATFAALDALPVVAIQHFDPQSLPALRAGDAVAVALERFQPHTKRPAFEAGRASILAPSATAKTVADTGSIRPVLRALASLILLAGSRRQIASEKADRNSSDGVVNTLPS